VTDTRDRSDRRHEAAYSVTGKQKSPLGWLPWAALLLLLAVAALIVLLVRNVGDDGDDAGVDVSDDPAAAAAGSDTDAADVEATVADAAATPVATAAPPTAANAATGSATTVAGAGSAGDGGAPASAGAPLTAGGQAILPIPAGGLASLAGQAVIGTAVTVESVVADEGFWVGSGATDRVFVFLTPQARTTAGESPFQVEAGQRINLQGSLIPLPGDAASLGVDPAEGAEQLQEQGHLVEATQIALS